MSNMPPQVEQEDEDNFGSFQMGTSTHHELSGLEGFGSPDSGTTLDDYDKLEPASASASASALPASADVQVVTDDLLDLSFSSPTPKTAPAPAPAKRSGWGFGRSRAKAKTPPPPEIDLFADPKANANANASTVAVPQAYDAFFGDIDNDINDLAAELTKGALEAEHVKSMKLNDAFVALETMRHPNLEIEMGPFDRLRCVQCTAETPAKDRPKPGSSLSYRKSIGLVKNTIFKHKPCLMCGSPTCTKHVDPSFKKSKVMICTECSPLFSLDFVIQFVKLGQEHTEESARKQRHHIKHMLDVYDRVLLMLEYTGSFIDEVATKLEQKIKKQDKVGVSANSAGVMSGVAGVAAAAAFVTPAGPPLLIASLFFGAAAQTTSSTSKMVNYYSTPNKMAFKIISLYNLCKSVLTVTTVLKDALLNDHINLENYVENMIKETEEAVLEMRTGFESDEDDEDGSGSRSDADELTINDDDSFWDDDASCASSATSRSNAKSPRALVEMNQTQELSKVLQAARDAEPTLSPEEQYKLGQIELKQSMADAEAALSSKKLRSRGSGEGDEVDSPTKQEQIDALKKDHHFMERNDKVGKLARFYSRSSLAGTSLLTAAAVTAFAGAALSIAHVAFEAKALAATLKRIQAGSPSKRASALRMIKEDIMNMPKTTVVAEEWDKYLEILRVRQLEEQSQNLGKIKEEVGDGVVGGEEQSENVGQQKAEGGFESDDID
jgi:hypothetical protein